MIILLLLLGILLLFFFWGVRKNINSNLKKTLIWTIPFLLFIYVLYSMNFYRSAGKSVSESIKEILETLFGWVLFIGLPASFFLSIKLIKKQHRLYALILPVTLFLCGELIVFLTTKDELSRLFYTVFSGIILVVTYIILAAELINSKPSK